MEIPIIIVRLQGGGFNADEARSFVSNLEQQMMLLNPAGIALLRNHIGDDF